MSEELEQALEQALRNIIVEKLCIPPENLKLNSSLEDVGADSLDRVEIVMEVEDQFNIEVSDSEVDGVKTFKDLAKLIQSKVDARK